VGSSSLIPATRHFNAFYRRLLMCVKPGKKRIWKELKTRGSPRVAQTTRVDLLQLTEEHRCSVCLIVSGD